ncbi:putative ADP-ribosylation factor GTPase-activating protein AGD11-like protein, partial [Tanacetum coccineum]
MIIPFPFTRISLSSSLNEGWLLISITVVGSAGPIRFVVNEEIMVATVVDTALKSYARERWLPVHRSNFNGFVLYCPVFGTEAFVGS